MIATSHESHNPDPYGMAGLLTRAIDELAGERADAASGQREAAARELIHELKRVLGLTIERRHVRVTEPTDLAAGVATFDWQRIELFVSYADHRRQYVEPGLFCAVRCCDCGDPTWGVRVATMPDFARAVERRRCASCAAAAGDWTDGPS